MHGQPSGCGVGAVALATLRVPIPSHRNAAQDGRGDKYMLYSIGYSIYDYTQSP